MKILHTSDWHIGRTLYGQKRHREFEAFFTWLVDTIHGEKVDVLLVAGDIFDNSVPDTRSQELYYRFLNKVAASRCRHVVIIAGNHDSPAFLDAPRGLLRTLDVHVVGTLPDDPEEEVLTLDNADGAPGLVVCAVPYLRERDIRVAEPGESPEQKERKIVAGIREHYARVVAIAEQRRTRLGGHIPLVVMGHLFTTGGKTLEGDGVRDLYVGSLGHVGMDVFPPGIDYMALGHLHVPQQAGAPWRRFSGSPLPMGFGEAGQRKSVCVVEFADLEPRVRQLPVPVFQRLARIRGDWAAITAGIFELTIDEESVWLEVAYDGDELIGDLRERLEEAVAGSSLRILRVRNQRLAVRVLCQDPGEEEDLGNLTPDTVFARCLDAHEVPEAQRPLLRQSYQEVLAILHERGGQAQ